MPELLLPLFPLEVVLLPGTPMPLHIFEDRYKEMVGEAVEQGTEFGIVQSREGGVLNIGCSATVVTVANRYPDGRMDIVILGRRRFEVLELDEAKAWLRARVRFFDDEGPQEPAPLELRLSVIAGLRALMVAEKQPDASLPDSETEQLSFRAGFFVRDLAVRQTLLALRSEAARLRILADNLPVLVARARRTAHARRVGPRNGHGMIHISEDDI